MLPEPGHELENVGVAPHPGGEPLEVAQGLDRLGVFADAANVPVDAIRIGPIRFGGDGAEPLLLDEPLRDLCAQVIEVVGPVRRLADEHQPGVSDELEDRIEGFHRPDQRVRRRRDRVDQHPIRSCHGDLRPGTL